MTAEEFVSGLQRVRACAGGFVACCPAHEDRHASLSVKDGEKGVVLKCHAGCDAEAVVKARGLELSALFREESRPAAPARPKTPPLSAAQVDRMAAALEAHDRAWKYVTETTLRFSPEVVRAEKLGLHVDSGRGWLAYPYQRRDGWTFANCRSINGERDFFRLPKDQPTSLYRGHLLEPGGTAILTEGERDAIAALTMGLHQEVGGPAGAVVVGMPGVNQVRVATEALKSQARVYLALDADGPGDEAAAQLGRALGPRAIRLRPPKVKDFGDLLAQFGPTEALAAVLEVYRSLEGPAGNSFRRMESMARGEYEPPPLIATGINALDRVLHGGIPLNKLSVFAARTSHGKTATAVRLTVNMVLNSRRTIVIWAEDEETEFDLRALAILSGTPFLEVIDAFRRKALAPIWARVPTLKRDRWRQYCSTARYERPTPEQVADVVRSEPGAVCVLDLLGEVDWGPGKKHELIGDGLRLIRSAALEVKSLFIGMTQLNRDWDRRKAASDEPEKVRPVLSDIENSGQIEQVARVCVIAEKVMQKDGDNEVPTGSYRYHVFKPTLGIATCRWHEELASPDNEEPVRLVPTASHWSDGPHG